MPRMHEYVFSYFWLLNLKSDKGKIFLILQNFPD
jgi:hypothetical protein